MSELQTLEEHYTRVLTTPINQGGLLTSTAAKSLAKLKNGVFEVKVHPYREAIHFYMLNHAMALIRQRVAPSQDLGAFKPIVERYYEVATPQAARMLCYLLWITTRETRHVHSGATGLKYGEMSKKFGPEATDFLMKKGSESDIGKRLEKSPPATSMANYVRAVSYIFHVPSWGSGYGGPAWGRVADCLLSYITGQTSAEAMLDTAWTLAHNNGPIFNKDYLYTNPHNLVKILDIQADGQIPMWVGEQKSGKLITSLITDDWLLCAKLLPEFTEKYADKSGAGPDKDKYTHKYKKTKKPPFGNVVENNGSVADLFHVDPNTKIKQIDESEVLEKVDAIVAGKLGKTMKALQNTAEKTAKAAGGFSKATGATAKSLSQVQVLVDTKGKIIFKPTKLVKKG